MLEEQTDSGAGPVAPAGGGVGGRCSGRPGYGTHPPGPVGPAALPGTIPLLEQVPTHGRLNLNKSELRSFY